MAVQGSRSGIDEATAPTDVAATSPVTPSSKVWLNGRLVPQSQAKVSVFDHGVLYGDGCFEGIRVYNGRIFKLASHLRRMYASARGIRLDPPYASEQIDRAVRETVEANSVLNGYVRLVFTRGIGTLGLHPFKCPSPEAFVIADSIQLYPEELYRQGLDIIVATWRRVPATCVDPTIKSLNYLNNKLAKIEAIDADVLEAIMLNSTGDVAECTGDNIFMVVGNEIVTPHNDAGILRGITRQYVIDELAPAMGHPVTQRRIELAEMLKADEVFLTGTAAEIIGVRKIDEHVIGAGGVGPVTAALEAEFRRRVTSDAPED
jgi:branched-chain amino acid aminotransferase